MMCQRILDGAGMLSAFCIVSYVLLDQRYDPIEARARL